MANLSLYDLAVLRRADSYTGLIEDVTTMPMEFSTFPAVPRTGTWYEVAARTSLPTAQFRKVNAGVTPSKSVYKKMVKEMFYVDVLLNVDEAVLKADTADVGDVWSLEAAGAMRAASILIGQQAYYGTSADAAGFDGLKNQIAFSQACGATTNSTTAFLLWQDPAQGVVFDVGKDGQFAISAPMRQQLPDPADTTKFITSWVGNLSAWIGLNVKSQLAVFACTGIKPDSTGNYLSDDDAEALMAQIPQARRNNLRWYMNRTAISTLRRSRSTYNPGITTYSSAYYLQPAGADGTPGYSPTPTSLSGWPIVTTDSLLNSETNS